MIDGTQELQSAEPRLHAGHLFLQSRDGKGSR